MVSWVADGERTWEKRDSCTTVPVQRSTSEPTLARRRGDPVGLTQAADNGRAKHSRACPGASLGWGGSCEGDLQLAQLQSRIGAPSAACELAASTAQESSRLAG